jgi:hypothetical protein
MPHHDRQAPADQSADPFRRRHHVRGHLVRRQNIVYWRSPHWRGHLLLRRIEGRTIRLKSGARFNRGAGCSDAV